MCNRAILIAVAIASGCTAPKDPWSEKPGPKVLAYFPALYGLAAPVAGGDAQVVSLLQAVGPHHFDPTARDALALKRADLFLTNGLGLDNDVAGKLAKTAHNPSLKYVALGEQLPKESLREGGCDCGHSHAGHEHEHGYDPHVWLGIPEAVRFTEVIADELSRSDPAHAAGYQARAAVAIERLNKMLDEGKAMLAAKSEKPRLITFHDSLQYFARAFGIEIADTIEAPGQEPSPKKLAKLVAVCRDKGVRLIAVEPQYPSHNSARVLLEELRRHGIDAAFVEIDPMETVAPGDLTPDYYERTTRANVARLAGALK